MIYAFDTNAFSDLFKSFYRGRFPSLWTLFDTMVEEGRIVSTREVRREIEDGPIHSLVEWSKDNAEFFTTPTAEEAAFVRKIFAVAHFQQNIEAKKLLKGGKNADPFVVARAATIDGTVVSLEAMKANAAKIPNICKHFGLPCINLEQFMEAEDWQF
jgi:hypothetical protein